MLPQRGGSAAHPAPPRPTCTAALLQMAPWSGGTPGAEATPTSDRMAEAEKMEAVSMTSWVNTSIVRLSSCSWGVGWFGKAEGRQEE